MNKNGFTPVWTQLCEAKYCLPNIFIYQLYLRLAGRLSHASYFFTDLVITAEFAKREHPE